MPRNMSFAMTLDAFGNRTKTVTRRKGWAFLKPGDIVRGVEKSMGLQSGEKIRPIGLIRIVDVFSEPFSDVLAWASHASGTAYADAAKLEMELEGCRGMTPTEFFERFMAPQGIAQTDPLNRIEFEHLRAWQVDECDAFAHFTADEARRSAADFFGVPLGDYPLDEIEEAPDSAPLWADEAMTVKTTIGEHLRTMTQPDFIGSTEH